MPFKNVAGYIELFAYDNVTLAAKTGDAANLLAYVSKDGGAVTQLADTSAAEISSTNAAGWYRWDVSASEFNADTCLFTGRSTTANVIVVGRVVNTERKADGLYDSEALTALMAVMLGEAQPHIVQTVTISGSPTGGTFTLTYNTQTTAAIAYNAAASAVDSALEALSGIGSGNVTVSGSAGGPYTVTFGGTLDLTALYPLSATSSLTGGTSATVKVATTCRYFKRDGSTLSTTVTYEPTDSSRSASVIA